MVSPRVPFPAGQAGELHVSSRNAYRYMSACIKHKLYGQHICGSVSETYFKETHHFAFYLSRSHHSIGHSSERETDFERDDMYVKTIQRSDRGTG
jgi:hypothetical protein